MIDTSLFCLRLKEERKKLFKSQAAAAEYCGVSRETWSRYERGKISPGMDVLAAIAAAGADVQYVLTGERSGKYEKNAYLEKVEKQDIYDINQLDNKKQLTNGKYEKNAHLSGNNRLQMADNLASYDRNNDLTPREAALLDNYRNIPNKEDQGSVERLALLAAKAGDKKGKKTGTEDR